MKKRIFSCDFETTVYEGQTSTEVWAAAIVELYAEDVIIFHRIEDLFLYLNSFDENILAYFHNLKFDGAFIMSYILTNNIYKPAYLETEINPETHTYKWLALKDMKKNTFKYSISDMGQWYSITIKTDHNTIEIRDSFKLLPFSVERIGKSFGTKHKKLNMEYTGKRFAGCEITQEEREYIKNDVLVVKEALEIMYNEGHDKLTIGSCCFNEFKRHFFRDEYKKMFPNLYDIPLNIDLYCAKSVGHYIQKAYRGGWCYLVPEKANKIIHNGLTADVNSLYPSMMHSESKNVYPLGEPVFWHGNYIPSAFNSIYCYGYIRILTRFYLKDNYLPCIQVKNNFMYPSRQWLSTSDVFYNGEYCKYYKSIDGEILPTRVELTLSKTDFQLISEHYKLVDFEVLDGCYFEHYANDLFDFYIDKYKKIKQNSTGAVRELAKLFLNNLYGKLATNTNSSFKVARLKEDGSLGYLTINEFEKKPGYIAIGAAITSYARNFTIRAAQKNFHGADKPGFIYADTDSIHCDLRPDELIDIPTHDTDFNKWKLESFWDTAYFVRAKTYIEHITHENLVPVEYPYYSVKCAGLNQRGKDLFLYSIGDEHAIEKLGTDPANFSANELDFLSTKRDITDFTIGIEIPGKLRPKNIPGGIVLEETSFMMR